MADDRSGNELERIGTAGNRSVYYDDDCGTYHTWYDTTEYEPVSTALLLTVSSVLGVEATDLEALSSTVDPDALNAIFVHWRGDEPRVGDGAITFTYAGCDVTVSSDGEIVIDPHRSRSYPEVPT